MSAPARTRRQPPDAVRVARLAGALLLLAGLVAAAWAVAGLGLTRVGNPGPGLWPMLAAGGLILSAVAVLVGAPRSDDYEQFVGVRRVAIATGLLAVFTVLFSATGLVPASMVLLTAWLRILSAERWATAVPLAAAITAGLYLVFVVALQVPVPAVTLPGW